jgi:O-antigen/teichoic acid export membrane protein
LFDLGLSTATSNAIAKGRGKDAADNPSIFLTSLTTNAGLGMFIGCLVYLIAVPALKTWSSGSGALSGEVLRTVPWLAASIPLVTIGGVFLGVLTAYERFLLTNVIGVIGTVTFQLVPLLAALWLGPRLEVVLPAAVLARAVPVVLFGAAAMRELPIWRAQLNLPILRGLLSFGGWVMISNMLGPILVSANQFVIAGLAGAAAVAHYSIAFSLVTRFTILPTALMQTLFPRLSRAEGEEAQLLAAQACRLVMSVMTLLCVPAILIARPFLYLWLGSKVGAQVAPVAETLLVSMWFAGVALIPFVFLQSQGRPGTLAKLHLLEVLPYFAVLYFSIESFGVTGAAFAWGLRVAIDAALVLRASRLPVPRVHIGIALLSLGGAWAVAQICLHPVALLATALLASLALLIGTMRADPQFRAIIAQGAGVLRFGRVN